LFPSSNALFLRTVDSWHRFKQVRAFSLGYDAARLAIVSFGWPRVVPKGMEKKRPAALVPAYPFIERAFVLAKMPPICAAFKSQR
jgi:hypothetical protein